MLFIGGGQRSQVKGPQFLYLRPGYRVITGYIYFSRVYEIGVPWFLRLFPAPEYELLRNAAQHIRRAYDRSPVSHSGGDIVVFCSIVSIPPGVRRRAYERPRD